MKRRNVLEKGENMNHNSKEEVVITAEEQKLLDKQGWFFHYVPAEHSLVNIHTHGLAENLHHMDLQIVLPIEKEMAELLLKTVIENIKNGYTYYEGLYNNVIEDENVEFKTFKEQDRDVLRIVFPDNDGLLPDDEKCQNPYNQQYIQLAE
ncbi:MAG: DUF4262 domain-containing protein [Bacillus sp. (in: firmicutes)]